MIEAERRAVPVEDPGRVRRIFYALYLAFIAVFSVAISFSMTRRVSPYLIGEWLINYSGGFVRRGLIGSLVLFFGHTTGISLPWIVFPIQVATFLLFVGSVYWLTKGIRWGFWMSAVLLSPATMAFTVLESFAGFRKECLLFAALALVICIVVSGRVRDWQLSALLSVIAVGLVLSHEALVVGFPYFFAAVAIQKGSSARAGKIFYAPALLAGIALVAVMLHPGNLAITEAICTSVGGTLGAFSGPNDNICSGSIEWLQLTLVQARAVIVPAVRQYHMVRRFSLLAIPTFTPVVVLFVLLYRRDRLYREALTVIACGALSLVGTAFLFYSAIDWGRWIHMQAICLMLMALLVDRRAEPLKIVRRDRRNVWLGYARAVILALYATIWTLPSIGRRSPPHGYPDVIRMLRSRGGFE